MGMQHSVHVGYSAQSPETSFSFPPVLRAVALSPRTLVVLDAASRRDPDRNGHTCAIRSD